MVGNPPAHYQSKSGHRKQVSKNERGDEWSYKPRKSREVDITPLPEPK